MSNQSYEDIYEYHFRNLIRTVKDTVGRSAINKIKELEDLDLDLKFSNHLFDIGGSEFSRFKACESEYRYWVEIYILKIIVNILSRKGIPFEKRYYGDDAEQNSILISLCGQQVEVYFLFDISDGDASNTSYDKIAKKLKNRNSKDDIYIYIFRDAICETDLADLINHLPEMNENGHVKVYPLKSFFDAYFGIDEYNIFLQYATDYYEKCSREVSYKTIIRPSQSTLNVFRSNKAEMLKDLDYNEIYEKGLSGELDNVEFQNIYNNYINGKRYLAMIGPNDFADSFISAEWSYDVYRNAMGELELTGIVAGYFKSVEQLLFYIIKFHIDEGFKINTKNKRGNIYYTKENEDEIDSTLGSLNDFITSRKSKLAISKKVRGCLRKAIDTWTKYQRNGYFHKDNIYARDNKIEEVRSLTLYLYFLILGGLEFSDTQLKQMGIEDKEKESETAFDFEIVYSNFRQWFIQVINYDLPKSIPGFIFLLTCKDNKNEATPHLMKYFYMDEFVMGENLLDLDHIVVSHINTVVPFSWNKSDENPRTAKFQFIDLVEKFMEEETISDQIEAIILGTGKETMLLYYKYMKEYNELDSLEENEEDE